MFPVETQEFRLRLYENSSPDTLYMSQNFHLVSLKILEFLRRKIFNQQV